MCKARDKKKDLRVGNFEEATENEQYSSQEVKDQDEVR